MVWLGQLKNATDATKTGLRMKYSRLKKILQNPLGGPATMWNLRLDYSMIPTVFPILMASGSFSTKTFLSEQLTVSSAGFSWRAMT